MNYYISDLHLGHYNIIRLCNRPFKTVEEMDETIINNWNAVVKPEDNVYIGGDFCFKSGKNPKEYLEKLNGHKYFIIGNHDKVVLKDPVCRRYFEEIRDYMEVKDGNNIIAIEHYPLVEWNGFFRGTLHFYGHIHNNTENNTYKIIKQILNAYNIGADILDFTPRTLSEVIALNKKFQKEH